jgi:hypothetical protein
MNPGIRRVRKGAPGVLWLIPLDEVKVVDNTMNIFNLDFPPRIGISADSRDPGDCI